MLTCGIEISLHSRAARRDASPPAQEVGGKAILEENKYKPWLHGAQNVGINKKKQSKQLTRQQKLRQQKALEKAGVNVDKLEKKVADSKARGKKVQGRRQDWDELNQKLSSTELRGGKKAYAFQFRDDSVEDAGKELAEDVRLLKSDVALSIRSACEGGPGGEDATVVYSDNHTMTNDDEVL